MSASLSCRAMAHRWEVTHLSDPTGTGEYLRVHQYCPLCESTSAPVYKRTGRDRGRPRSKGFGARYKYGDGYLQKKGEGPALSRADFRGDWLDQMAKKMGVRDGSTDKSLRPRASGRKAALRGRAVSNQGRSRRPRTSR